MIDNYSITSVLGKGFAGVVYKARHLPTGGLFAIKTIHNNHPNQFKLTSFLQNEFEMTQKATHPHILKVHSFSENGQKTDSDGNKSEVAYMTMALAPKGDLFEIVLKNEGLNENLTRFLAQQLVSAISYLHKGGKAHRDIKLENILLDARYNCKLADLGFATEVSLFEKNKTFLGTQGYKSPQLEHHKAYDAMKADVFALGVLLFSARSGCPPFSRGFLSDKYYKVFIKNKEKFWAVHSKRNKVNYSEEFKELIEGMLALKERDRFSIFEVSKSKFIKTNVNEEKARTDIDDIFNSN